MEPSSQIIVGVTGLPSSGKGVFGEIAKKYGFKLIVMGDVIRDECKRRGLPINRESSDKVMVELRKEKGENAVAIIVIDWILEAIKNKKNLILVDGIRSLIEVSTFKTHFPNFIVIGIHANTKTRLKRAMSRKREDDAFSKEAFEKRDQLELQIGIGDVIARADVLISSNYSLEKMEKTYSTVIQDLLDHSLEIGVKHNE
jgi:dephospho-CoA kinase